MNRDEHLARLKALRIERKDGPVFNSPNECMQWIDNVAPLLRYNANHYNSFMEHAEYVRITKLSADLIMAHLNPMIGIVNQAITELENNIEPEQRVDSTAAGTNIDSKWYQKAIGLIGIGVFIVVLGAGTIWILNHYFGFDL